MPVFYFIRRAGSQAKLLYKEWAGNLPALHEIIFYLPDEELYLSFYNLQ